MPRKQKDPEAVARAAELLAKARTAGAVARANIAQIEAELTVIDRQIEEINNLTEAVEANAQKAIQIAKAMEDHQ